MKQNVLLLLALAMSSLVACDKDRVDFYLDNFTVNNQLVTETGRYRADAILDFRISFRSDDPDDGNYTIEEFDFLYEVNGSQPFVIQSDRNMGVDAFSITALVDLLNLELPEELGGGLIPGDEVLFVVRATDSDGDTLERTYKVIIQ